MSERLEELKAALKGHYEVERELGQGGMATVYLARDTKHDRQVAIKVLRPELAAILGAERFLKEITVTANLQHPNILPLYDSGQADTFLYYVMPYLEGESLRDKLDREKQIGIEETVKLAAEIAAGLHYAHGQGVIHRDIKPENILLQAGQAIVADFGIALAVSQAGSERLTETGLSLGTPHYMSPEQATGDAELNARCDVYSLGAMVYEMLTGEPPHRANTVSGIVAKILTETPAPITQFREFVPANVDAAVHKALAKSPADRFESAAKFAEALVDPHFTLPTSGATTAVVEAPPKPWTRISIGATALALIFMMVALWAMMQSRGSAPVMRFGIVFDSGEGLSFSGRRADPPRLSLLPDGSGMVYVGVKGAVEHQLWLRRFDRLNAVPLPGTEFAWGPAVSPDGQRVAFVTSDGLALKVVSLAGGPAIVLVDSDVNDFPGWGVEGDYLYFFRGVELARVATSGGTIETVATFDTPGRRMQVPRPLPGGTTALATAFSSTDDSDGGEVRVLEIETGTSTVLVAGVYGAYDGEGHLLFVTRDGSLMAAPWTPGDPSLGGLPVKVADGLDVRGRVTELSVSRNGVMLYTTPGINTPETLVWVSMTGEINGVDPDWVRDIEFEGVTLSPDDSRLAVEIVTGGREDIWVKQLDRGPLSRLTFEGPGNSNPTWTADGEWVSYASRRAGGPYSIWRRRANGTGAEELVARTDRDLWGAHWSTDGDWLILGVNGPPGTDDIMVMRIGVDSVPLPLLGDRFNEIEPALSPDSRWLAYMSDETGQWEVYVRPFPNVDDGRWQISIDGGSDPLWSRDGRRLYYRPSSSHEIHVADMAGGPDTAPRRRLLELPAGNDYERNLPERNRLYDVTADGRFVMIQRVGKPDIAGNVILVLNSSEELRAILGR